MLGGTMPGAVRRLGAYLGLVEDGTVEEVIEEAPVRDVRAVRHDSRVAERSSVRTIRNEEVLDRPIAPASRVESGQRLVTLVPQSFNDCQRIGEAFRAENSVVIDFTQLDAGLRRRIIDFASGLVFGLHGRMQRVTETVYVLSPRNVDIEVDTVRQATTGVIFNHS
jgi:cell division inhibitor SepF